MRVRIRFSKIGKIRFTSHRDVARIWERALRRAQVPMTYSEGFSPRPRMSFGLALSTGYESEAEYLELELTGDEADLDLPTLIDGVAGALPNGLDIMAYLPIERGGPSLQEIVTSCTWRVDVPDTDPVSFGAALDALLARDSILVTRERKGKERVDDLRPSMLASSEIEATTSGVRLEMDLASQPRSVRPPELLAVMDPPLAAWDVRRMNQWIHGGPDRTEPLAVADVLHPRAEVRV